jgi:hypothetical protein
MKTIPSMTTVQDGISSTIVSYFDFAELVTYQMESGKSMARGLFTAMVNTQVKKLADNFRWSRRQSRSTRYWQDTLTVEIPPSYIDCLPGNGSQLT